MIYGPITSCRLLGKCHVNSAIPLVDTQTDENQLVIIDKNGVYGDDAFGNYSRHCLNIIESQEISKGELVVISSCRAIFGDPYMHRKGTINST